MHEPRDWVASRPPSVPFAPLEVDRDPDQKNHEQEVLHVISLAAKLNWQHPQPSTLQPRAGERYGCGLEVSSGSVCSSRTWPQAHLSEGSKILCFRLTSGLSEHSRQSATQIFRLTIILDFPHSLHFSLDFFIAVYSVRLALRVPRPGGVSSPDFFARDRRTGRASARAMPRSDRPSPAMRSRLSCAPIESRRTRCSRDRAVRRRRGTLVT